jgi:DNA-binding MarR family transcriptional regulator
MSLQTILFGTWTPPKVTNTTTHRIGMCGGNRYEPSKSRVYKTIDGLNSSEFQILEVMKKYIKHVSATEIAKMVEMTNSHCGITLCSLFKKGYLKRYKGRANGTNKYFYCLKENNGCY